MWHIILSAAVFLKQVNWQKLERISIVALTIKKKASFVRELRKYTIWKHKYIFLSPNAVHWKFVKCISVLFFSITISSMRKECLMKNILFYSPKFLLLSIFPFPRSMRMLPCSEVLLLAYIIIFNCYVSLCTIVSIRTLDFNVNLLLYTICIYFIILYHQP